MKTEEHKDTSQDSKSWLILNIDHKLKNSKKVSEYSSQYDFKQMIYSPVNKSQLRQILICKKVQTEISQNSTEFYNFKIESGTLILYERVKIELINRDKN